MNVKLIAHTPEPEKLIAAAAKVCYSSSPVDKIMENLTDEAVEKFLTKLVDAGHESPCEHASFTFMIDGVSRAMLAQITRHRLASFSVRSQRYVDESKFNYTISPTLSHNISGLEKVMANIATEYQSIKSILMSKGFTKEQANEQARAILPNACTTSLVMTMNARELMHFFNKRCCMRAQDEIRSVANEMLSQCREVAPVLFKNAGAPCVSGECPEKEMGCQK